MPAFWVSLLVAFFICYAEVLPSQHVGPYLKHLSLSQLPYIMLLCSHHLSQNSFPGCTHHANGSQSTFAASLVTVNSPLASEDRIHVSPNRTASVPSASCTILKPTSPSAATPQFALSVICKLSRRKINTPHVHFVIIQKCQLLFNERWMKTTF